MCEFIEVRTLREQCVCVVLGIVDVHHDQGLPEAAQEFIMRHKAEVSCGNKGANDFQHRKPSLDDKCQEGCLDGSSFR
ncbi:hypothetical protein AVEN_79279-1 [Araneus ventricosus]|uniref:Uncharacterized protein n=1 Tax=Araneus ventricosus TaxID=182803 RepID=A0A4Y2JRB1_ARAVE|nr:hypothetical protein AVEN_79279-1 [Araneus ventricosus]